MTQHTPQDSQSALDVIIDKHLNEIKAGHDGKLKTSIEAYVTTRVKEALENARSKEPHKCESVHEVYSHNTADGWCCACEADQAFMEAEIEARVKEAERLARIDENLRLKKQSDLAGIPALNGNGLSIVNRRIGELVTTTTNGKETN